MTGLQRVADLHQLFFFVGQLCLFGGNKLTQYRSFESAQYCSVLESGWRWRSDIAFGL